VAHKYTPHMLVANCRLYGPHPDCNILQAVHIYLYLSQLQEINK
jgi:hypothetical protein